MEDLCLMALTITASASDLRTLGMQTQTFSLNSDESPCPWFSGRICCIITLHWVNSSEPHTTVSNSSKTPLNNHLLKKIP